MVTTSQAIGDILYADTSTTYTRRAVGSQTTFLAGGTTPSYRQIDLGSNDIGNNLPVSKLNGGTNASSTTFWRGDASWKIPGMGFVSSTSISSNNSGDITIAASKLYKVIVSLTNISADDTVLFRINSDGGSNYTDAVDGNTTYITVGQMEGGGTAKNVLTAEFLLDTNLGGSTGFARIVGDVISFNSSTTALMLNARGGSYQPASGAPTSFEILSSGGATLTGNIYLYEFALS